MATSMHVLKVTPVGVVGCELEPMATWHVPALELLPKKPHTNCIPLRTPLRSAQFVIDCPSHQAGQSFTSCESAVTS